MAGTALNKRTDYDRQKEAALLRDLDRGIDDMEIGRELPINEAFQKINELRATRRDAR